MKILYFARLRQLAGRSTEEIDVPPSIGTVAELVDFLSARDETTAAALADRRLLKVALNQAHAQLSDRLDGVSEVAFFPPVTGG